MNFGTSISSLSLKLFAPILSTLIAVSAFAASTNTTASTCRNLPSYGALKKALIEARMQKNGGLNYDMWAAVVDRSGVVCNIVYSGKDVGSQWPGSRVIAAQKANTANAFSLPTSALSTANLYYGTQPGGFLFGLTETNPVDTLVAYRGDATEFGSEKDPMIGGRIGGVNVFGGGLALYDQNGNLVGALGVSGDTSCADHNIAWRTRNVLKMDYVPGGVAKDHSDQIIYDIHLGKSSSGFGHPTCIGTEDKIAKSLTKVRKPRSKIK